MDCMILSTKKRHAKHLKWLMILGGRQGRWASGSGQMIFLPKISRQSSDHDKSFFNGFFTVRVDKAARGWRKHTSGK